MFHNPSSAPRRVRRRPARGAGGALALLLLAACGDHVQSVVNPSGIAAHRIAGLWWTILALTTAVELLVIGVLAYAVLRKRGPATDLEEAIGGSSATERRATRWVLLGGVALPVVTLIPILVYTLVVLGALAPRREPAALAVEVTGRQWWWEVRYLSADPRLAFTTANEIHVPVGRRVEVRLKSNNVIHSFWVPTLQGKLDVVPGKTNVTWIEAGKPGRYRGQCAEYCGLQHAHMALWVVAEAPDAFERWAAGQRQPAPAPDDPAGKAGQRVFLSSQCVACHTIRGTPAAGRIGPDLTHVGGRLSIGAGLLPNTPANLAGWVADPQRLKPGNAMPRVPLQPEQLRSLVDYLTSLR